MGNAFVNSRRILILLVAAWPVSASAEATAAPVDFAKEIAPLLVDRCLSCHDAGRAKGGLDLSSSKTAFSGGDTGPVIVPSQPKESGLLERITPLEGGARPEMPQKGDPLSAEQVALLRRWIAEGASWPEGFVLRQRTKADLPWWSLQPLAGTAPPSPDGLPEGWSASPIDRFVFASLREMGLSPSPPADRRTLIRRVTFDLNGLPPAPEEVEAFARDERPDAYERLVDRSLASPHYGERWGRHWLDVARFAESHGFEFDKLRDHAWRYRDYVIRSLNDDTPYSRFVQEQIAGDVLEPITADGIAATGFLVAGPWDEAGIKNQKSAVMQRRMREEELEDMVSAVAQTFLGLTVNCARCHDHKFDPIPQRDYYRLKAALEGVRHGDRPALPPSELAALGERSGAFPPVPVYAAIPAEPPETCVLARGDVERPGERVAAGGLSAIETPSSDFGLTPGAPEAERRRRLAVWIADPVNPLTARVLVNRVWHYHFGAGIVATPNDFGANGDRPSHPGLLDWLAGEFLARGGRLKALHRLILTSATYRQASRPDPKAAAVDAEDRFLWRFPPRRLEAEAIRDAMLAVAGNLNPQMGGPSFRPFTFVVFNSNLYTPTDPIGPEFDRRTIYRMNVNSARSPLLEVLDCPDPSVKTPRRAVTTTPLQALGLMNDPFVWRQARGLSRRVVTEAGADPAAQVDRAYLLALGRAPTAEESSRGVRLAREHGLEHVGWALLNCSEFLYLK